MNKKAQNIGTFIFLAFEFIIVFKLIEVLGPELYKMTEGIPLGAIFRIILPSPEGIALDYLKIFLDTLIITVSSAIPMFKK